MTRHSETEEQMGKQKQQMQGYHPCQGTDRGVVEIRDGKFYDGEAAWFPDTPSRDGFYWFYFTDDHWIKDGRLCGPHASLEAAAESAVVYLDQQDIELALEALAARGELGSCVRPDGVREYWLPDDAADTGSASRSASRGSVREGEDD
jgi:hypothetical protein